MLNKMWLFQLEVKNKTRKKCKIWVKDRNLVLKVEKPVLEKSPFPLWNLDWSLQF